MCYHMENNCIYKKNLSEPVLSTPPFSCVPSDKPEEIFKSIALQEQEEDTPGN